MIIIAVAVLLIALTIWFVWKADNAPTGYEDEDGFHYGDK